MSFLLAKVLFTLFILFYILFENYALEGFHFLQEKLDLCQSEYKEEKERCYKKKKVFLLVFLYSLVTNDI